MGLRSGWMLRAWRRRRLYQIAILTRRRKALSANPLPQDRRELLRSSGKMGLKEQGHVFPIMQRVVWEGAGAQSPAPDPIVPGCEL